MSFGCSARFLFGDDGNSLRSTMLRSGDVFIFGNSARLLQHGIAKVFPRTLGPTWQRTQVFSDSKAQLLFGRLRFQSFSYLKS